MIWHLIPETDIREHIREMKCECEPIIDIDPEEEMIMVIHNTFEFQEQIQTILQ